MAAPDHLILELVEGRCVVKDHTVDVRGVGFEVRVTSFLTQVPAPAEVHVPTITPVPASVSADELKEIAKLVRESDLLSASDLEVLQAAGCVHLKAVQDLVSSRQAEQKALEDHETEEVDRIFDKEAAAEAKKQALPPGADVTSLKQLIRNAKYGNATLPQPYEEIRRLLKIERTPLYAKALEEWARKEALFTSRVERKNKKESNLKNEIYQLIGFFSVFQGVLLTAVSQSNLLHCNNQWSPISLSVVASVVSIAAVTQKLLQINRLQKTIHSETRSLKDVVVRLEKLRSEGVPDPAFKKGFKFAPYHRKLSPRQSKFWQWMYFALVIGSLLSFAVCFPVSHWRIVCYPGPNPYATSGSASN